MARRVVRALLMALVAGSSLVTVVVVASAQAQAAGTSKPYYVSLGDSYSVGYQHDIGSTSGYTGVVAGALGMQLENFGCGGATTKSLLDQVGCSSTDVARTDAVPYPTTTQVSAADSFLRAHRGHIGLITVSIGGNTVTACAAAATPIKCVIAALSPMKSNIAVLAADLRSAAGGDVPIIGTTYPDVILGEWVYPPTKTDRTLAKLSLTAFKEFVNPALQAAYATVGGNFVDVTTATGAYTPLTQTTTLPPYGTIPVAVAKVCELTYFCTSGTIHANTTGYTLIGNLVVSAFSKVPTVSSFTPTSGPAAGGTTVTITGTGFAATSTVHFGAVAATAVTVDSATKITATTPAGVGTVAVFVTSDGETGSPTGDFTYTTPLYQPIGETANPGVLTLSCTHGAEANATAVTTCPLIVLPTITLDGKVQTVTSLMNTIYVSTARRCNGADVADAQHERVVRDSGRLLQRDSRHCRT
jgi:hypothetical protein